jgi:hypothetical protein
MGVAEPPTETSKSLMRQGMPIDLPVPPQSQTGRSAKIGQDPFKPMNPRALRLTVILVGQRDSQGCTHDGLGQEVVARLAMALQAALVALPAVASGRVPKSTRVKLIR